MALHLPATGYEAGGPVPMTLFDKLGRSTPHIAKGNPAAAPNVPDFRRAGGVPAVMKVIIAIDIPNRSLRLEIKDNELQDRLSSWPRPPRKISNGYLGIYSNLVRFAHNWNDGILE